MYVCIKHVFMYFIIHKIKFHKHFLQKCPQDIASSFYNLWISMTLNNFIFLCYTFYFANDFMLLENPKMCSH